MARCHAGGTSHAFCWSLVARTYFVLLSIIVKFKYWPHVMPGLHYRFILRRACAATPRFCHHSHLFHYHRDCRRQMLMRGMFVTAAAPCLRSVATFTPCSIFRCTCRIFAPPMPARRLIGRNMLSLMPGAFTAIGFRRHARRRLITAFYFAIPLVAL